MKFIVCHEKQLSETSFAVVKKTIEGIKSKNDFLILCHKKLNKGALNFSIKKKENAMESPTDNPMDVFVNDKYYFVYYTKPIPSRKDEKCWNLKILGKPTMKVFHQVFVFKIENNEKIENDKYGVILQNIDNKIEIDEVSALFSKESKESKVAKKESNVAKKESKVAKDKKLDLMTDLAEAVDKIKIKTSDIDIPSDVLSDESEDEDDESVEEEEDEESEDESDLDEYDETSMKETKKKIMTEKSVEIKDDLDIVLNSDNLKYENYDYECTKEDMLRYTPKTV